MNKIRKFTQDNALMLSGMLLMLASSGIDGRFLSLWMSEGLQWLGYVLNLVSDSVGYVLSDSYAKLQNSEDDNKRRLSRVVLVFEFVNIAYSWLFSYLVLRGRFVEIMATNPITSNPKAEVEILAFVSAGFVPLTLCALGYVDALSKTKSKRKRKVSSTAKTNTRAASKPATSNTTQTTNATVAPAPVDTLETAREAKAQRDLNSKQQRVNAMLSIYERNPHEQVSTVADSLNVSRTTVYKYLQELEELGKIHSNGQGVKVLA